jgi:tripeptide aminopeptidase
MKPVIERFLRYVKIDTQSDPASSSYPSTSKQFDLAHVLVKELQEMGVADAEMDRFGYVTGTIPANFNKEVPVIGFIAHMDTSPSASGKDVKPQLIENYDGKDILLNAKEQIHLSPITFPALMKYVGQDLIVTDGRTLLGADDKAGVAEIMTAADWILHHPEFKHGTIKIGFTPDEEVGRGVDHFDVKKFGAQYAYTLDGNEAGELEYECFNAASASVTVHGLQVHPGTAKDLMKNAILIATELLNALPAAERPEHTAVREGFIHVDEFTGSVDTAKMTLIIRDHDQKKFEQKKAVINKAAELLNIRYGPGTVEITMHDSYYNMKEKIEPVMEIVTVIEDAMRAVGLKPKRKPIRGGTDGARLSFMGLPCPNFFTGGLNYHGIYEFVSIPAMEKATEVVIKIVGLFAEK